MTAPPMSDFGQLLFETAKACQGRSCVTLDRVLTAKVRAWLDEQDTTDKAALASYDHGRAKPFEGAGV